ncbi:MAG: peptidoglycan-binding protein [Devosia sp.]
MSVRGRLCGLVLLVLLSAGPAQSQDVFQKLLSIMNENARTDPGNPTVVRPAADAELLQVQRQLASKGYDVGVPDGVMGPRTQRAIAAYQQSIGTVPTGTLTTAESDKLLSGAVRIAAPTSTGSTGRPDFDLLYDVDLPGNDFRSGMSEPALKRLTLDECLASCAADGRCRAFTYNVAAKVCFLKSTGTNPSAFSGAISGMRKDIGGAAGVPAMAASPEGLRPLLPSEVAQMQAGLNQHGYDAGTPDGVIGGKTRAAIASFLADNPGRASQDINVVLMQAVLGQSPGSAAAPPAIDAANYRTLEEADRDLALVALGRDPTILDQSGMLQTWFSRDARSADFGDNYALITAYDNGNTVERDAILARYRQTLLDEAAAFVADPANLQFRIRMTSMVQFGAFEPGKGLAIRSGNLDVLQEKRMLYRTIVANRVFGGLTLDAPTIASVPVADQAAAAALIDAVQARSGNQLGNITVWLTISEIGIDRNAAAMPLVADIPMTVSVDKVALMTYGRDGKMLGEEMHVLYLPSDRAGPPTAPADNLLVAQNFGLRQVEGYVALTGADGDVPGVPRAYQERLIRFLNMAAIRLHPDRMEDWIEEPAIRSLMTQAQHLRVYGQTYQEFHLFTNEFDRREAMAVYTSEVVPALIATAPSLPIDIVSTWAVQLGEYDFASSSFPFIMEGGGGPLFQLPDNLGRLRSTALYQNLPTTLAVDEATAELWVRAAAPAQPVVYLATFGSLSLPPAGSVVGNANNNQGIEDPLYGALVFTPTSTSIFVDAALTRPLLALDPAVAVHDPEGPRLPPPPSATELALNEIVVATEVELLAHVYDRLDPQGLATAIIDSSDAVRRANEFDVAMERQKAEQLLADASRRPVWLKGIITLGTYSTDKGSFDAAEVNFYLPDEGGFAAGFNYSLLDPRQLTDLPIPAAEAKQIAEMSARQLIVLAQVDLVDITPTGDAQAANYRIALDIKEMLILTDDNPDASEPQRLIARIKPGGSDAPVASQLAAAPPLRQLDPETLDYLRIKYAPETMDDAAYERMMSARWAMEQTNWVPPEEFFFPAGTDMLSPGVRKRWLPDFKAWALSRLPSLSDPLSLVCAKAINGESWPSPLQGVAQEFFPGLADTPTIDRIAARFAAPHLTGPVYFEIPGYLMEDQVCGNGVAPMPIIEALGLRASPRSGAVVRVENVALPGNVAEPGLDLVVDSVEIQPHPDGGKPILLLNTHFDRAWKPGAPPTTVSTAADMAALLAETETAPLSTPVPEEWDIVGLKPGQTLEQADAIIREHMQVAAVYVRQQGQRTTPYFSNEISYLDATLSEAITLIYEPTAAGDIVFLIAREVGKPADSMPTDDILEGLRTKYGPERRADLSFPGQFKVSWYSQEVPKSSQGMNDQQRCGVPFVMAQGYWTPIEGSVDAMDPSIVGNIQVRGYMVLPGTSDLYPETLELGALDCGIAVMADKHKTGNNDSLMVQMFDYAGYARAYAEAQELGQREATTGSAEGAAPALDIKF